MRHRRKVTKLSRVEGHRRALLKNLASELFVHERVTTTDSRAKALRPFAERLITKAKDDTVHSRREVSRYISDKNAMKKLFTELSPRFKERPGGYTRIMKLTSRPGDGAKISIIELVGRETAGSSPSKGKPGSKKEGGKGSSRKAKKVKERKTADSAKKEEK